MPENLTEDQINIKIRSLIQRSGIYSSEDSPATVATLMVVILCLHLGVKHEEIPQEVSAALIRATPGLS